MADHTDNSLRGALIYQVFTRNYGEGTFAAVERDLERIRALGTDILYLLPIHPSGTVNRKGSMGSPYAISDYRAIDPVQGTLEDFIRLADSVHALGMRLVIDVVYNHTSPDSVLAHEHPEWFYHRPDGRLGNRIGEWWDVVDLDYSVPALWDYQIETLKQWARYVDGFRCDVAPILPLEFWLRAREAVEQVRPGCIWIAESVEPRFIDFCRRSGISMLSDGELYRAFDICYDHDAYYDLKGAIQGTAPLSDYVDRVNAQETIYPANYDRMRFLENHDRPRAAALLPDRGALLSWTAWSFFAKGATLVYAGQEYGATHHPTLFDRDPIDLSGEAFLSPMLARLSALIKHPLFTEGCFRVRAIGTGGRILAGDYQLPGREDGPRAYGFFPIDGQTQCIHTELPDGRYTDALSGSTIDVFEGALALKGAPVIILTDR